MIGLIATALLAPSLAQAQSVTIQGRVQKASGDPVNGPGVLFRVQIATPNASRCVLYDETYTVDMSQSNGLFSINLNDGLGTRSPPTTYSLAQAFSNHGTLSIPTTYCAGGGAGTTNYSPSANDNRKVVIQFRDPSTTMGWEAIPEMDINPVPFAIESRSLGGYTASSVLRVLDPAGPAPAASFTSAQLPNSRA